jgi:hypothetical protein
MSESRCELTLLDRQSDTAQSPTQGIDISVGLEKLHQKQASIPPSQDISPALSHMRIQMAQGQYNMIAASLPYLQYTT